MQGLASYTLYILRRSPFPWVLLTICPILNINFYSNDIISNPRPWHVPSIRAEDTHRTTSWSLLGPGVEVGLAPNIMKGINIFPADVIKDFLCNYDRIIQVLGKKGNKEKKIFTLKVFEAMPHGTLKFQIVFWALRPTFTKKNWNANWISKNILKICS